MRTLSAFGRVFIFDPPNIDAAIVAFRYRGQIRVLEALAHCAHHLKSPWAIPFGFGFLGFVLICDSWLESFQFCARTGE